MKTRLLSKLRREASEHFRFTIIGSNFDTFTYIKSHDKIVHTILYTGFGRILATQLCKDKIREYILNRVQQIRSKQYYDKRRKI